MRSVMEKSSLPLFGVAAMWPLWLILLVAMFPRAGLAAGSLSAAAVAIEEQTPIGTVLPVGKISRWPVERQRGKPLQTLRTFRTDAKLFVVHLWGTWCKPCREELMFFKQMFPDGRSSSGEAQLILIAIDSPHEKLSEFYVSAANSIPLAPQFVDEEGLLTKSLDRSKVPVTLLVDRQWVVRQAFYGSLMSTDDRTGFVADRRNELISSIERYLRPPLLTSYADDYLRCAKPPCIEPSYFLHRSLVLGKDSSGKWTTGRWTPRLRRFVPGEVFLPIGNQTTFLYIFPPSCKDCLDDLALLQKVSTGWRQSGSPRVSFAFLMYSDTEDCAVQTVLRHEALFAGIPVFHTSLRELGQLMAASGIPVTLIMNRQGYVRHSFVGLYRGYQTAATAGLLSVAKGK